MSSKTCSKCGASLPADAKFCFSCGTKTSEVCSKCGAELFENSNFCGMCGHKILDNLNTVSETLVATGVQKAKEVSDSQDEEDDSITDTDPSEIWKEIIENEPKFDWGFGKEKWEKIFTASGGDLNARDENGLSLIHIAAKDGWCEVLEALVEAGVDIDLVSGDRGFTPLICAAEEDRMSSIELLIELGADVNKPDQRGTTAIATAALCGSSSAIEALSEAGANIDSCPNGMPSPLKRAMDSGSSGAIITLIEAGVDPASVGGWSSLLAFAENMDEQDDDLINLIKSKIS